MVKKNIFALVLAAGLGLAPIFLSPVPCRAPAPDSLPCLAPYLEGRRDLSDWRGIDELSAQWMEKNGQPSTVWFNHTRYPIDTPEGLEKALDAMFFLLDFPNGNPLTLTRATQIPLRLANGSLTGKSLQELLGAPNIQTRRAMLLRTAQLVEERIPPEKFWGPFELLYRSAEPTPRFVFDRCSTSILNQFGVPGIEARLPVNRATGEPIGSAWILQTDSRLRGLDPDCAAGQEFERKLREAILYVASHYGSQAFKQIMEQFNYFFGVSSVDALFSQTRRNAGFHDAGLRASIDFGTRYGNAMGDIGITEALSYCEEEARRDFQKTVQRGLKLLARDQTMITVYEARPDMVYFLRASLAEVWSYWACRPDQPRGQVTGTEENGDIEGSYAFLFSSNISGPRAFLWRHDHERREGTELHFEFMKYAMADFLTELGRDRLRLLGGVENPVYTMEFAPKTEQQFIQFEAVLGPYYRDNGVFDVERFFAEATPIMQQTFIILYMHHFLPRHTDPRELQDFALNTLVRANRNPANPDKFFRRHILNKGLASAADIKKHLFLADAVLQNLPQFETHQNRLTRPARASAYLLLGYNIDDDTVPVDSRADGGQSQCTTAALIRDIGVPVDNILMPVWDDGHAFLQVRHIESGVGNVRRWQYEPAQDIRVEELLMRFFIALHLPNHIVPEAVKIELIRAYRELAGPLTALPAPELLQAA